jgi:hypothetical protein
LSVSTPRLALNFDKKRDYNASSSCLLLCLFPLPQVERINFYTTSNKQIFSVKVSPTLPTIIKHDRTSELPMQSYANDNNCQSTSLPLVRLMGPKRLLLRPPDRPNEAFMICFAVSRSAVVRSDGPARQVEPDERRVSAFPASPRLRLF